MGLEFVAGDLGADIFNAEAQRREGAEKRGGSLNRIFNKGTDALS